jgi:hypothetical protein
LYLKIKEATDTVKKRFEYFDRYLKPDFFQLFLGSIDSRVSIKLITTTGKSQYGVNGVIAVAKLVAKEFADFQFIEVSPAVLHDRNLRLDDQIFSLGPGVDRAGIALTIFGPTDSSDGAHEGLDKIIASGNVVI